MIAEQRTIHERVLAQVVPARGGALVIGLSIAGSAVGAASASNNPTATRRVAHRRARRAARPDADRLVAAGQPRQHGDAVPRLGRARPGHADGGAPDRGRGARPLDRPGDGGAARHERRRSRPSRSAARSTCDGDGRDEHARRGGGARKALLLNMASAQLGVPVGEPLGRRTASSRAAARASSTPT